MIVLEIVWYISMLLLLFLQIFREAAEQVEKKLDKKIGQKKRVIIEYLVIFLFVVGFFLMYPGWMQK